MAVPASLLRRLAKLEGTATPTVVLLRDVSREDLPLARVDGPGGPWVREPGEDPERLRERALAAVRQRAGVVVLHLHHEAA